MKKSLIAFAALASIAGAASAQSSVTLYGRIDLAVGKPVGNTAKYMGNGSGSRFGVRGVEDLGGGMSAFFQLEHRFDADTGAQTNPARFWAGRSIVGLQGGFGKITLGREYTTAFLGSQLVADPWGWDTVVSATPGVGLNTLITGGGVVTVRNDSSLTYNFSAAGFSFGAQIAEAQDTINNSQKKPVNFFVGYSAGPLTVGLGHERIGAKFDAAAKWTTVNASFDLGAVKLGAFYGTGNTAGLHSSVALGAGDNSAKRKSWLLSAVAPLGQGEFRASYGKLTSDPGVIAGVAIPSYTAAKGFALGYHYALSKRTTIYADFVRNTGDFQGLNAEGATTAAALTTVLTNPALNPNAKNGYDFGIKHNF